MILRSRRVVLPDGVRPAAIRVAGGRIAEVLPWDDAPDARDVGDAAILPGLLDAHVHLNEPGRTEWEGFATATAAAAAGGITALVDMPLNSIPATITAAALATKRAAADGQCRVDVAFWGGVVPGNAGDLDGLAAAGARGFKCFLVGSGVPEFPAVDEADLRLALPILARLGLPLLAHAELAGPIDAAAPAPDADPRRYATYLASRPAAAEEQAIALLVRLCRDTGARVHVVHLSAASALPAIAAARAEGLPVTAETCPHYLHLAAEDVPDGATPFKCAPPIRGRDNREALWGALADGHVDMIVSDHSPCTPALKQLDRGDFGGAWGGIAGLQLALPVVWTEASRRGRGLSDVVRWMCEGPARLAGLDGRKGRIAPGHDADLVVFRPEARFRVDPARLRHRHRVTPYAGEELVGVVDETFVRGVAADGEPRGMLL